MGKFTVIENKGWHTMQQEEIFCSKYTKECIRDFANDTHYGWLDEIVINDVSVNNKNIYLKYYIFVTELILFDDNHNIDKIIPTQTDFDGHDYELMIFETIMINLGYIPSVELYSEILQVCSNAYMELSQHINWLKEQDYNVEKYNQYLECRKNRIKSVN